MNQKKFVYLASILIMMAFLVQSSSIMSTSANPVNYNSKEISIEQVNVKHPFVDSSRKFVLYFNTKTALDQYVSTHKVDRVFPHMKMVIVNDLLSHRAEYEKAPGIQRVFDVTNTKFYEIDPPAESTYIVAGSSGVKLTKQSVDILNVSFLWGLGHKGEGIVAYDIDSGINTHHVDFQGRIMNESKSFITKENGYDVNDPSIEDTHGHGTHTAGIMAGAGIANPDYIGMAPAAKILVGRLGSPAPPEAFIAAFEYGMELKDNGTNVDVINLSWGGGDAEGQNLEEVMVRELFLDDILIAIAAGNSGTDYFTVESPGAAPQGIAVAATKQTGIGQAYFSSVGPTADGYVKPDLAAPGMGIMSCGIASSTAYISMQGTSMATPAITGAAGVLIDVLKAESIPHDPGMIKTAMMLAGDGQGSDYLQMGAGVPDLGKAYELIKSAPKNATGFPAMLWAIPELNVPYYQTMVQGFYGTIYVKSVSSTPWEDLTPVMSGTITQIATLNTTPATGPWEKNYALTFNVPDDAALGDYTGKITFETSQGVKAETLIHVKVLEGHFKLFYGKMHTDWGADHSLGQYYYFFEHLKSMGVAVNEFPTGEITATKLNGYSAIWFPDPVGFDYPNYPFDKTRATSKPFTDSEIQAIQDFVANGGGLFIDLLGEMVDSQTSLVFGNNVTMLNELISPYDITISPTPYKFDKPDIANVVKMHRITRGVTKIDHYGTTLTTTGDAVALVSYHDKPTVAAYENDNGGRVVVATTNFFMDTKGYLEDYNDGTQNAIFSNNIMSWLLATKKVIVRTSSSDSKVDFNVTTVTADTSLNAVLQVKDVNGTLTNQTVSLTSAGSGKYTYTLNLDQDGVYTLFIMSADDFYVGSFFKDSTPPVLTAVGWTNGSAIEGAYADFTVSDMLSSLGDVSVTLNGEKITVAKTPTKATFRIYKYQLTEDVNTLHVHAVDALGNILDADYVIYLTAPSTSQETTPSPYLSVVAILGFTAIIALLRRKR